LKRQENARKITRPLREPSDAHGNIQGLDLDAKNSVAVNNQFKKSNIKDADKIDNRLLDGLDLSSSNLHKQMNKQNNDSDLQLLSRVTK